MIKSNIVALCAGRRGEGNERRSEYFVTAGRQGTDLRFYLNQHTFNNFNNRTFNRKMEIYYDQKKNM